MWHVSVAGHKSSMLNALPLLSELSESASDPLELEETYIIKKLTMDLPMEYDIVGK